MADAQSPFRQWQEHTVGDHIRMHYVGGEHVIFIREVMEPGCAGPRHRHDRVEELRLVASGAVNVTVGEETRTVAAGDVVVVPRSTEHELYCERGATYYLFFSPAGGRLPVDDFHLIEKRES